MASYKIWFVTCHACVSGQGMIEFFFSKNVQPMSSYFLKFSRSLVWLQTELDSAKFFYHYKLGC